tara:strand:- start:363 stop:1103 length:741 start_codon:yes stop_codon:yes gene_type:complete
MDNTAATILTFILITFFFSIIRFVLAGTPSEAMFTIFYFILIFTIQFSVNTANLQNKCGNVPYTSALYFTIIPWLFIFCLLYVCLIIFPGWKGPFSNTFGYAIASVAGVKNLLVNEILEDENILKKRKEKMLLDIREDIYKSPELLINEITPDNFDQFWNKLQPLFRSTADDHRGALKKIVHMKDIVADFIWFCLAGAFTISVSFNNIANVECQQSASDMENTRQQQINKSEDNQEENRKVYVHDD